MTSIRAIWRKTYTYLPDVLYEGQLEKDRHIFTSFPVLGPSGERQTHIYLMSSMRAICRKTDTYLPDVQYNGHLEKDRHIFT
jgi:hypothetical protein